MIEITLVTNDGAGLPVRVPVVEGTTLEKFLEVSFEGNPDEFTIRIRANGTSVEAHRDYVLQDGDRVSMSPTKVDGATKGPGTNAEQIQKLRGKVGEDGVDNAENLVANFDDDVIALAYKMTRVDAKKKLPASVTKLISNMSEEDAKLVRGKLVEANAS